MSRPSSSESHARVIRLNSLLAAPRLSETIHLDFGFQPTISSGFLGFVGVRFRISDSFSLPQIDAYRQLSL